MTEKTQKKEITSDEKKRIIGMIDNIYKEIDNKINSRILNKGGDIYNEIKDNWYLESLHDAIRYMIERIEKWENATENQIRMSLYILRRQREVNLFKRNQLESFIFSYDNNQDEADEDTLSLVNSLEDQSLVNPALQLETKQTLDFFQEKIKNQNLKEFFDLIMEGKNLSEIAENMNKSYVQVKRYSQQLNQLIREIIPESTDNYRDQKPLPQKPKERDFTARLKGYGHELEKSLDKQEKALFRFFLENQTFKQWHKPHKMEISRTINDKVMIFKCKLSEKGKWIVSTDKTELNIISSNIKQFEKLDYTEVGKIYNRLIRKAIRYIPELVKEVKKEKDKEIIMPFLHSTEKIPEYNNINTHRKQEIFHECLSGNPKTEKPIEKLPKNQKLDIYAHYQVIDLYEFQTRFIEKRKKNREKSCLYQEQFKKTEAESEDIPTITDICNTQEQIQEIIFDCYKYQGLTVNQIVNYLNSYRIINTIAKDNLTKWNFKHIDKCLKLHEDFREKILKKVKDNPMPTIKNTESESDYRIKRHTFLNK